MRAYKWLWIAGALLAIHAGCAALPQSFNQNLLVSYGTVTEVRRDAVLALNGHKITADDAQNLQNLADEARKGLDIARSLHAADPAAGQAKLDATRAALIALQTYLATQEAKK